MRWTGRAWTFGDHVDTDVIIPARYLTTSDPHELAKHCMEDIEPSFAGSVRAGDIVVAGENFGCGSSREHAPLALQGAGIACVIAASFARIFYRNAFNIGLPIVVCPAAAATAESGHLFEVDIETGLVMNRTLGLSYEAETYPSFILGLIKAGGLTPFTKKRLAAGVFDPLRRPAEERTRS
ncbi:MAG: 3-isopropylmalate dehydratase small subunit [Candidatus Bipolaricaulota bacterium]